MNMAVDCTNILKKAGLKVTKSRVAVLDLLFQANKPINHSDIMKLLPTSNQWDRVTIYRTLSEFEERCIVKSLHSSNRVKYYEYQKEGIKSHGHKVCEFCGDIECLDGVFKLVYPISEDFHVSSIEVLIRGICKFCR